MLRRVYPVTAMRIRTMHSNATTVTSVAAGQSRALSVGWTGGDATKPPVGGDPFFATGGTVAPAMMRKPQQQQAAPTNSFQDAQRQAKENLAAVEARRAAAAQKHEEISKRYSSNLAPEPITLPTAPAWSVSPFPTAPVKMADALRRNLFVEAPRNTGSRNHDEELEWETDLTGLTVRVPRTRTKRAHTGKHKNMKHKSAVAKNKVPAKKKKMLKFAKRTKAAAALQKKAKRAHHKKMRHSQATPSTEPHVTTLMMAAWRTPNLEGGRSTMESHLSSDSKMAAQTHKAKQAMGSESRMSEAASTAIAATLDAWSARRMTAGDAVSRAAAAAKDHESAAATTAKLNNPDAPNQQQALQPEAGSGEANFERVEWRYDGASRTWQKWHQDLKTAKWRLAYHTKSNQQKL